ncbi:long-chain acyl-CoA synthetase [Skermanella aerolata]|uniref:AMP-dependent synthetase/ligase n=1 Tax=Skermanella aerolata TaxID=393310 RepID=UPI003D1DC72D
MNQASAVVEPGQSSARADWIASEIARTVPGLFRLRAARSGEDLAYRQFEEASGTWRDYSWGDMDRLVACWRHALRGEALTAGDRVAALLRNSVEWVCFDLAAQSLGLVMVPLFPTDTPGNIAYVLADSGARLLLVETVDAWRSLAAHRAALPSLRRVLCLGHVPLPDTDGMLRPVAGWLPDRSQECPEPDLHPEGLATLIYTSGTTGRPKGVMISHRNLLSVAEAILERNPGTRNDVFLSYLPLAHCFERVAGYYVPMMIGANISFARSIDHLPEDLLIIRPTILLVVPRVLERIYRRVRMKAQEHCHTVFLLDQTVALGLKRYATSGAGQPATTGVAQRIAWPLLRRLVADRVLARLGGRVRLAVSGGAPLSEAVARFFVGLGLPLIEGYGLTEATAGVCAGSPATYLIGAAGEPFHGVTVSIGQDGEILVRSPGVMLGYWNRPEATSTAIDAAGWLHTGDIGEIRHRQVFIRGRLKEIIVTSTGEKVSPADMEMAITLDRLFEQAMVSGNRRPFLVAVLVLNRNAWPDFARVHGLDPDATRALHSSAVKEAILAHLSELLQGFPRFARIHAVHLCLEPWKIEGGLLTPTMKLKRDRLERRFTREIEELYRGHETSD